MKFLCVPCDQPMKLTSVKPPDRGSLSVVYACAACGYEMAMLTNPYETQVVSSLGVKIEPATDAAGPAGAVAAAASPTPGDAAGATNKEGGGKCPFAEMIPGLMGEGIAATTDGAMGAGAAGAPPAWTDAAVARLEVIPSFVRPMARTGIERFARERGYATIDETVLDEARDFFGM
ncbi:MAG TPA: PCP reductase family protein [Dongiaceae bacterium]|nr:PCP reductase family protein [Dongiaceae bacterium]